MWTSGIVAVTSWIVGWIGLALGLLTLFLAFFIGNSIGGYIDGFCTIITYVTLIVACHMASRTGYFIFLVANACLIVGKAIYLLILLVIVVLTPGGWQGYTNGGGLGGVYPDNGILGYGSGSAWGMSPSLTYGSSIINNPYEYGPYGYGGRYGSMYLEVILMFGLLLHVSLGLTCYVQYIGFRAYQITSAQHRPLYCAAVANDTGYYYTEQPQATTALPSKETYLPVYNPVVNEGTRF
ncbi:hypothetical protein DdX_13520 [Ditylenchus destructor]|uniref:Uncharacterized protein n=1 Tax=Ditylenchus destructor TaxID=166010 RepID=A0AAD4R2R1_9BILA|nr:hypothetical protein DdX_13520 [Ditylenchus destructor]